MGCFASEKPLSDSLAYFGAEDKILAACVIPEKNALILPESLFDLAEIFLGLQSQWRWHEGRIIGFDYAGIRAYLDLSQSVLSKKDFARLQYLEVLCLKIQGSHQKS